MTADNLAARVGYVPSAELNERNDRKLLTTCDPRLSAVMAKSLSARGGHDLGRSCFVELSCKTAHVLCQFG